MSGTFHNYPFTLPSSTHHTSIPSDRQQNEDSPPPPTFLDIISLPSLVQVIASILWTGGKECFPIFDIRTKVAKLGTCRTLPVPFCLLYIKELSYVLVSGHSERMASLLEEGFILSFFGGLAFCVHVELLYYYYPSARNTLALAEEMWRNIDVGESNVTTVPTCTIET